MGQSLPGNFTRATHRNPQDEPPTPRSDEEKSASESTDSDPVDSDDSGERDAQTLGLAFLCDASVPTILDFKRMNFGDASPTSAGVS